ncbi:MAG: hypothetical protein RRZ65_05550 [Tannerellaceae bacterium]
MNRITNILFLLILLLSGSISGTAQKKNFSYKFYGQVRGDLFYNSRANEETVDGLFYMYPKDIKPDADGNDLNATPNGSFYLLYSRLGLDVKGPNVGKAASTAKIEVDFRGSSSNFALIRIRQAYVNLDWGKSDVTIGQTWHPLYGDVTAQVLNLSSGAPFQPFNRSPMIRYRFKHQGVALTAAALWQLQYLSTGPSGKSEAYIKNSCVPEIYLGADYKASSWLAGAGVEILSLKPRTQSVVDEKTYKVDERITTCSFEAHAKYTADNWHISAKTLLASNLTQTSMLGGYGVSATNRRTGENEYTPYRHSSTWVNVVYGKKWKPGIFLGYLKNLGTTQPLTGATYGTGLNVDQLVMASAQLTYNLPHWKVGAEYSPSVAWYGDTNPDNGKIENTHSVTNHRLLGVLIYMF